LVVPTPFASQKNPIRHALSRVPAVSGAILQKALPNCHIA
jgi:hypothetical protein